MSQPVIINNQSDLWTCAVAAMIVVIILAVVVIACVGGCAIITYLPAVLTR